MIPGSIRLAARRRRRSSPSPAARCAQKTQLTVYTALETDQLKAYEDGFNKVESRHRAQVGARLDRRHHRQAARREGEPAGRRRDGRRRVEPGAARQRRHAAVRYAPINLDAIMTRSTATRRTRRPGSAWTCGARRSASTPSRPQKKNIPKPETWKDLTKPVYKGQIVMPNPASSGTGYFDVTAWLTLLGDDNGKGGGWKYMDALHENIAQYTHSGSKPCNMAATGEYVVGISFEYRANTQQGQGRADRPRVPEGRPRLGPRGLRHHKGTKKLDAAKKLADWASSKDAMQLYGKNFAITRAARRRRAAGQRAGRLREAPGQDRLQDGGRQPRARSSPSGASATTSKSEPKK